MIFFTRHRLSLHTSTCSLSSLWARVGHLVLQIGYCCITQVMTAGAAQHYDSRSSLPAGCPAPGPAAPQNAANYNCPVTASGGNCSTACLPSFNLVPSSSLQIGCSLGNWSTPTGICIGAGEL
jgi:hypothetical protein